MLGEWFLNQGGPMMWVIVGCGLFAFGVFVERALHLHRARIKVEDFLAGVINILRRRNISEALTICEETPGPVARIVKTAILHRYNDRQAMREAVDDSSLAEISRMERRLVVVATVAQSAPLLGLLGTVLAMIDAVSVMMRQTPLVQSGDIMDGVMRALLVTAAGLTVAVPCHVGFNLLIIKIDRLVLDMEKAASEIVAFLSGPDAAAAGKDAQS